MPSASLVPPVRAVNLGCWLVVEGWIKPSLFDGIPNKDFLDGTKLQFKSVKTGKYLSAAEGGGYTIVADKAEAAENETFKLWRINEKQFNLRVANKQFVGLSNAPMDIWIVAAEAEPEETEIFEIHRKPNDLEHVRIKASNGCFLQVKSEKIVTADYKGREDEWRDDDPSIFLITIKTHLRGEYQLVNGYGSKLAPQVMKKHWDTFIVEEDFKFMKENGLNTVRIPVGWWTAKDPNPPKPYVAGSLQFLDKAFTWAEKYEIKVIVDLHAAPGSQSGTEPSSSRDGVHGWEQAADDDEEGSEQAADDDEEGCEQAAGDDEEDCEQAAGDDEEGCEQAAGDDEEGCEQAAGDDEEDCEQAADDAEEDCEQAAEKNGLRVINVHLHAAPGSQSGWEPIISSSRDGEHGLEQAADDETDDDEEGCKQAADDDEEDCEQAADDDSSDDEDLLIEIFFGGNDDWVFDEDHIEQSLEAIEFFAARYAKSPSLLGVELLNEPGDPEVSLDALIDYYERGYEAVRKHSPNAWVVMCDRLGPLGVQDPSELLSLTQELPGSIIDVHYYNVFELKFKKFTVQQHIDYIQQERANELQKLRDSGARMFIGEWAAVWDVKGATKEDHKKFAEAQLQVYGEGTFGWGYWTFRNVDTHWSLEWMIKNGYIKLPQL